MKELGKAMTVAAIWGGIALLSYLFNSFGILKENGAVGLVAVGFVLTLCNLDIS